MRHSGHSVPSGSEQLPAATCCGMIAGAPKTTKYTKALSCISWFEMNVRLVINGLLTVRFPGFATRGAKMRVLLASLLIRMAFFICLSSLAGEQKRVIGVSQCNLGEPWRVQMNADIRKAAAEHPELTVVFKDAQNDTLDLGT
jgi:hypothetical protein